MLRGRGFSSRCSIKTKFKNGRRLTVVSVLSLTWGDHSHNSPQLARLGDRSLKGVGAKLADLRRSDSRLFLASRENEILGCRASSDMPT